jgi:regulator of sigma E protease
MLIAILVIIGLSVLIFGHEAGHFFVAKLFGMKVDEFGFGFPPKIFGRKKGETEYSLNWLPFGGFVKIAGETTGSEEEFEKMESLHPEEKKKLFCFQPPWRRFLVIAAGVVINFLIGWLLLSSVLMVGTPKALVINQVQPGSPAAEVGLASGDVIKGFVNAQDFVDFTNRHRGEEVSLTVTRSGKDMTFAVTPRLKTAPDEGAIGVEIVEAGEARQGFLAALRNGFEESWLIAGLTLGAFYELVKNLVLHGSLMQGVVGPVGIFSVAQETGRIGLIYLVQLVSLISINLAVINLIPFPALDGGRLLLIVVEKIKGSPISRRVEIFINGVGFALLILLMVLLTVRDVGNLF